MYVCTSICAEHLTLSMRCSLDQKLKFGTYMFSTRRDNLSNVTKNDTID